MLGRFCLDALAKIRTAPALEVIARAIVEHEACSDHAAHLLGEIGEPAHGVLARIYPHAGGEQRLRILNVLARGCSKDSLQVFADALLTPELAAAAAALLRSRSAELDAASIRQLRDGLQKRLADDVPPACVAEVLTLLASIDAAGSKALFLRYTEADSAAPVRAAAFRALQGIKLTANQLKDLMGVLEDPGQKAVHESVREVLVHVPELPPGMAPGLKRLLASRQPEQRLFALRMLRTAGGTELARTFVKLLDHDDDRFRQAAREGLAQNKQAVEPLLKLLQTTRNPQVQQDCAAVLMQLAHHLTPKLLKATAEKAVKLLSGNARLGDLLLDLVLQAGGAKVAPFVIEKAVRMRRAHRQVEALHVLAKVAASEHGGDEAHYQIALTKLLAAEDAAADGEGAPGNSTMGFFAVLVRGGFPLFERLRRESAVKPEMLLRVATHFATAVGAERRFGTELLQHLAQRTKGRAGDEARLALRTASM
ncbi:MAG: HEAT repeat domain-containing protein [Planctomycetes bacterium]|nr:HEAT repeat domain-containing protein [Planctomycetota bacterium]